VTELSAGQGGLTKDGRKAARLFRLATDHCSADGTFIVGAMLGQVYEQGRGGLKRDLREAIRLYKVAANAGNGLAQKRLRALGMPLHVGGKWRVRAPFQRLTPIDLCRDV